MPILLTSHSYSSGSITFATYAETDDAFSLQVRNSWKPDLHTLLAQQLLSGEDFFLDLGANIGTFCLPVAKITGSHGLAVDALQSNIALLQAAIQANQLSDNVKWFFAAIVDSNGEVAISGEGAYGTVAEVGRRVLAYSVDGLMDEIGWPSVKLVKMDIEGCEMRALEGAPRFLDKNPHAIFIFEANGAHCYANGYAPQDLIRFFEIRGHYVYLVRGNRIIRRASRDFQEAGLCDYVASPFPLEQQISGFRFIDFDEATKVRETIRTLSAMKPGYARFMVSEMHLAPEFIRKNKEVQELVAKVSLT
jgi:FkbM family methyltransferase